jgi:hypothetical protein
MSEQAPVSPEKFEALPTPEHLALPTAEQAEALRPGEQDPAKQLEAAREAVEANQTTDNPIEKLERAEQAAAEPAPTHVNRELKDITLGRELKQIRSKLKAPDKVLSRVIHQPVIRAISETSGKTVARPSGLFGGGLVALIGTTSYLLFARHIGLQYNYFAFIVFFAAGFGLGLVLELAVWSVTRRSHQG